MDALGREWWSPVSRCPELPLFRGSGLQQLAEWRWKVGGVLSHQGLWWTMEILPGILSGPGIFFELGAGFSGSGSCLRSWQIGLGNILVMGLCQGLGGSSQLKAGFMSK